MRKTPLEHEVRIDVLSDEGLGGATLNDRPLWVRNALPGEHVQARIVKRRGGQRFADGVPLGDLNRNRSVSACEYFPRCGGCNLHHVVYPEQLLLKQGVLADALQRVGVAAAHWRQPTGLVRLGYRRKARLGVRVLGEQVLLGFRESFSNRVARMDGCMTLTSELSALLKPLKTLISGLSQPRTIPQVELAAGDQSVALLLRHLEALTELDIQRLQRFADSHNVQVILQPSGYDKLRPLPGHSGVLPLSYKLPEFGLNLQFYAHQFTQVNALMNRELIRVAASYLGNLRGRVVADLFCGIGNFSLPLARQGATVVGVEGSAEAIAMARRNAHRNGLERCSNFIVEDLYDASADSEFLTFLSDQSMAPDALLLDPPRSGAGAKLDTWAAMPSVQQVVYISCNPRSFADDAQRLQDAGFRLREVGVYDMFPQTAHIETIGHFVRNA